MNTTPKLYTELKELVEFVHGKCRTDEANRKCLGFIFLHGNALLTALAPPSGEGVDSGLLLRDPRNFRPVAWEHQCSGGRNVLSYIENDERIENVHRVRPLLYSDTIRAMIDATTPQSAPVDGEFVLVPREPTPQMIDATWDHKIDRDGGIESQNTGNHRIYTAMLDAAPTPPPASQERGYGKCPKCGAPTDPTWGHIGDCKSPSSAAEPKEWILEEIETKRSGYECEHNFVSMPHKPTFDYCTRCGTSRRALDAAEQAKLVAINPVEIYSKLIPDAAEQAKPMSIQQMFDAEQAQAGELPELPEPSLRFCSARQEYVPDHYTADQMREYANACRLAGGVTDEMLARAAFTWRYYTGSTENNARMRAALFAAWEAK